MFFEIGCDSRLFDGLKISEDIQLCREYMGRFPVVSVSLKSVGADDYETARSLLIEAVGREARRLQFLLDSPRLSLEDKKCFPC